jgi:hypothetical protein
MLSRHTAASDPVQVAVDDRDQPVERGLIALSPCDEESRDIGWRCCDARILLLAAHRTTTGLELCEEIVRSLGGRQVGVRQVDEYIRLVTFMHYDLD